MTKKTMKDCCIVNGFTESGRFLSIRQSRPFTKITTKASAPTASQISGEVLLLYKKIQKGIEFNVIAYSVYKTY